MKIKLVFLMVIFALVSLNSPLIEANFDTLITYQNADEIALLKKYDIKYLDVESWFRPTFWFSPSTQVFALYDGVEIRLINTQSLLEITSIPLQLGEYSMSESTESASEILSSAHFIHDDNQLLIGTKFGNLLPNSGRLFLMEVDQGNQIELDTHVSVENITVSHDNRFIAYTRALHDVVVMDSITHEIISTFPVDARFGGRPIFSPVENILGIIQISNLSLMDTNTGFIQSVEHTQRDIIDILFDPSGRYIAQWNDFTVFIRSVDTLELEAEFIFTNSGFISAVAFLADEPLLVIGGSEPENHENIQVWNYFTGESIKVSNAHQDTIFDIAINPDFSLMASASRDGVVKIWNIDVISATSMPIYEFNVENEVLKLDFSPLGNFLIVQTRNSVQIFGME